MKSLERTRKRHVLNPLPCSSGHRHSNPLSPRPSSPHFTAQPLPASTASLESLARVPSPPRLLPACSHGCLRGGARGSPPGAAAGAGGRAAPAPRRAQGSAVPVPRERVGCLRGRGRRDRRVPGPGQRVPGDLRVPQGLDRSPRLPRAARPRRHPAAPARHVRGRVRAVAPHRRQGGSDPFPEGIVKKRQRCSFPQLIRAGFTTVSQSVNCMLKLTAPFKLKWLARL